MTHRSRAGGTVAVVALIVLGVSAAAGAQTETTAPPPTGAPPRATEVTAPSSPLTPIGTPGPLPQAPTQPSNPTFPVQIPLPGPPPPNIPSGPTRALEILTGPFPQRMIDIHPTLSLSEEYTDNFFLTRHDRKENFRSEVAPGLILLVNRGAIQLRLGGNVSGVYDTLTDQISERVNSLGGIDVRFQATPRLRFSLSDFLTRSDEPTLADRLNLRRGRASFTSNTLLAAGDYTMDTVALRAFYQLASFLERSDTESQTFGASLTKTFYETNRVSVGGSYLKSTSGNEDITGPQVTASYTRQLTSLSTAGITGSYSHRDISGGAPRNDAYDLWTGTLFTSRSTGRLTLNSNLGYTVFKSDSGQDFNGLQSFSGVSYNFGRGLAALGFDQGASETFAQGQNFGVVNTRGITGSLTYSVTPRVSATVAGFYRHNEFTGVAGGDRGRIDDTWGGNLSVVLRLLRWMTIVIDLRHTEASSTRPDSGYTENRVRTSLNLFF